MRLNYDVHLHISLMSSLLMKGFHEILFLIFSTQVLLIYDNSDLLSSCYDRARPPIQAAKWVWVVC